MSGLCSVVRPESGLKSESRGNVGGAGKEGKPSRNVPFNETVCSLYVQNHFPVKGRVAMKIDKKENFSRAWVCRSGIERQKKQMLKGSDFGFQGTPLPAKHTNYHYFSTNYICLGAMRGCCKAVGSEALHRSYGIE